MLNVKSIDELKEFKISPVNVYWNRKSGNKTLLLAAGGIPNFNLLQKVSDNIEFEEVLDDSTYDDITSFLVKLEKANLEYQRVDICHGLLSYLSGSYWFGEGEKSMLPVVLAFTQKFLFLPGDIQDVLKDYSEDIYQRSFIYGTLSVIYAISIGHYSYSFLREIFNIVFLFEYNLLKEGASYDEFQILDSERRGDDFFSKERDSYNEKIKKTYVTVQAEAMDLFDYDSVLDLVGLNKESLDGTGFPRGLNGDEMSDLERLIISLNRALDFKAPKFSKNDGKAFLSATLKLLELDQRLMKFIESSFNMDPEERRAA